MKTKKPRAIYYNISEGKAYAQIKTFSLTGCEKDNIMDQ